MQANRLGQLGQALLAPFAPLVTRPGFRRFVPWLTGLVLNVEEHTVTPSLVALDRPEHGKALEAFVAYGAGDRDGLERATTQLLEQAPGRRWYGYRVGAADDSKGHRSSARVGGTWTFPEYTARCPNRAGTVRAHHWLVLGALLHRPEQPACFLPVAGRLYCRTRQLPPGEAFPTKCPLLVTRARPPAAAVDGDHRVVFDGALAVRRVVRPRARPTEAGQPSREFLTRLRGDAVRPALPTPEPARRGPWRKWGRRGPPPAPGGRWPGAWQQGRAWIYGRERHVRGKEVVCWWRVLGWERPVKGGVAAVEGYRKRFTRVSNARDLSGLQLLERFGARFRPEDGLRDLKQRLGWEECRAWTKEPIRRTTPAPWLVRTLLRLLPFQWEAEAGASWWFHPPWHPHTSRARVRALERLGWQRRQEIRRYLAELWGSAEENPGAATAGTTAASRRCRVPLRTQATPRRLALRTDQRWFRGHVIACIHKDYRTPKS